MERGTFPRPNAAYRSCGFYRSSEPPVTVTMDVFDHVLGLSYLEQEPSPPLPHPTRGSKTALETFMNRPSHLIGVVLGP